MTERETESAMAEDIMAFDFQCVEQIVPEVHDVPVDYIITEKEMITCRQACQEIR